MKHPIDLAKTSDPVPRSKRVFDLGLVVLSLPLTLPILAIVAGLILWCDGRPVFFAADRSGRGCRPISVWKFRTMQVGPVEDCIVCGAHNAHRISRLGAILRRWRLDELPQIWNVVIGQMSWVGPRPPEQVYVNAYPTIYGKVLECRPGLTGLATLTCHRWEQRLLAVCDTATECDRIYRNRCIPRKAKLDLLYASRLSGRSTVPVDLWILLLTIGVLLGKNVPVAARRRRAQFGVFRRIRVGFKKIEAKHKVWGRSDAKRV